MRPDQCLGLGWQIAQHPEHLSRIFHGQMAAFKAGHDFEDTHPLRRADGEWRWFLTRATPIKDTEGHILRWLGTNTDITERLEAERALAASEERFRRALAIETVGVIFFTTDGAITDANDAFLRLAGYTRDELRAGRVRWDELTPPEFMPRSLNAVEELKAKGLTTSYEKRYIRKDGSRWWALFAAMRLNEREAVEFVVDITPQKEAEAELKTTLQREHAARTDSEKATRTILVRAGACK